MILSFLNFALDLILGSLLTFLGPNVLFFGPGLDFGPTHVLEQLSFSMISSILHFLNRYNLGVLFDFFWALMGYFLGSGSWDSTEWTVRASFC